MVTTFESIAGWCLKSSIHKLYSLIAISKWITPGNYWRISSTAQRSLTTIYCGAFLVWAWRSCAKSRHRFAYTLLFRVTYGIIVNSDNDVLLSSFQEVLECIVDEGPPGASIIDLFPIRKCPRHLSMKTISWSLKSNTYHHGCLALLSRSVLRGRKALW